VSVATSECLAGVVSERQRLRQNSMARIDTADTAVNIADSAGRVAGNRDRIAVPDTGSYCHKSKGRIAANTAGTERRPSSNINHTLVPVHRG
jgi:hypothetical protein